MLTVIKEYGLLSGALVLVVTTIYSLIMRKLSKKSISKIDTNSTAQIKIIPNNSTENDTPSKQFTFTGDDSLSVALFAEKIFNLKGLHYYSVDVTGTDGRYQKRLSSSVASYDLDGYIRSISLYSPNGETASVAGSNATLENISAHDIIFTLPNELYENLELDFLIFYENTISSTLKLEDALRFKKIKQPKNEIMVLKQIKTKQSLLRLLEMLQNNYEPETLELLCESFRVFRSLPINDIKLAENVVFALINYISKNRHDKDRHVSIVYSIESLGYFLGYIENNHKYIQQIILLLKDDKFVTSHKDITWSMLVALQNKKSNIDGKLLKNLIIERTFRGPLEDLANSIQSKEKR